MAEDVTMAVEVAKTKQMTMAVDTLLLPAELRHTGGHDAGGSTAAAVGQVAAVRILHAIPVGSYCCLLADHCPLYVLQQPPEQISIRPAKSNPKRVLVCTLSGYVMNIFMRI